MKTSVKRKKEERSPHSSDEDLSEEHIGKEKSSSSPTLTKSPTIVKKNNYEINCYFLKLLLLFFVYIIIYMIFLGVQISMFKGTNSYLIPLFGTFFMYLNILYLYLYDYLNGILFGILLITLIVLNAILLGLSVNVHSVNPSFVLASVFVFLIILYESPLFFFDYRLKTENYLYIPTEEIVSNTNIHVIGIIIVNLPEKEKILMEDESNLLKVIPIDNYHRYTQKNRVLFQYLHNYNWKNQDIEMAENLEQYIKGTNTQIMEYLSRSDVTGASSGLALAISSLITESDWNNLVPVAVTGAIDDKGNVLEIGLVREKIITAARDGHTHVIIPKANLKEAQKAKEELGLSIEIYGVTSVEEAVNIIKEWNDQAIFE